MYRNRAFRSAETLWDELVKVVAENGTGSSQKSRRIYAGDMGWLLSFYMVQIYHFIE